MELQQWLLVYQAITETTSAKERNYWMSTGVFLIANLLLLLVLAFLATTYSPWNGRWLKTTLGVIGLIICLFWLFTQRWTAREISHWESHLRGIEGQFAGSEFHRSSYRFHQGEQVCMPASSWKCSEWYPEVHKLSWCGRIGPQAIIGFLSLLFLLGWVALAVANILASSGTLI